MQLSLGQFAVMMILFYGNGAMTAQKLAERTGTTPSNITSIVNTLKRRRLINTKRGEADRRFSYIELTDQGRKSMTNGIPLAEEFVSKTMSPIGENNLTSLDRLIFTIENTLTDNNNKSSGFRNNVS